MARSTSFEPRQGRPEFPADLQDIAQQIHQEFDDRLDPPAIDECLATEAAKFEHAAVRSFVPLLVGRYVRDELHERLAHA